MTRSDGRIAKTSWDSLRESNDMQEYDEVWGPRRVGMPMFVQGDLLLYDLTGVTHVFVASLCFSIDLVQALGERFG